MTTNSTVLTYERALQKALEKEWGKGKATTSYLRQDLALLNNTNQYIFDFSRKGALTAPERFLADQDVFYATRIKLGLIRVETGKEAIACVHSFPDPSKFTAVAGFEVEHLEAVYNGSLETMMENNRVVTSFPLSRLRRDASKYNSEEAHDIILPSLIIDGDLKREFKFTFPTFNGIKIAHPTTGNEHKIVLQLEGFVVTGVSRTKAQKQVGL